MKKDQKQFEKKLGKYYLYFEKNKMLLENIAIITRIMSKNNIDPIFLKKIYRKNYLTEKVLESILLCCIQKINLNDEKISLYEKWLLNDYKVSIENILIVEQLKILYLLSEIEDEVISFEKENEKKIEEALYQNKKYDTIVKLLFDFIYKIMREMKAVSKKNIKIISQIIKLLIFYESISQKKNIEDIRKKYFYNELIFIFRLIKVNIDKVNERELYILKDILRIVFNRIVIEKETLEPIFREILKKYLNKTVLEKDIKILLYFKLKKSIKNNSEILELI